MELPDLKHDFRHAQITRALIGPRREVTLTIQLLKWEYRRGYYSGDIVLRCGGIENLEEVARFFSENPTLEVAHICYADLPPSKPNSLFIEVIAERIEASLTIHCRNITVSDEAAN